MATTIKPTMPATLPLRLHLLEEKLKGIVPSEGADLENDLVSLTRLYRLTLDGQMSDTDEPIAWDLPDSSFGFASNSTTLIKQTLGEYYGDYGLNDRPLAARLLAGDESGARFTTRSMLSAVLGTTPWTWESTGSKQSLAAKTLGSQDLVDEMLDGSEAHADNLLGLLKWVIEKQQADYDYLLSRINALS